MFSSIKRGWVVAVASVGLLSAVQAASIVPVEGVDYKKVEAPIGSSAAVGTPQQVKVVEFFSYACHWCANLEPLLSSWRTHLPAGVTFERVPVEFHPGWTQLAKTYYAAVALGQEPHLSPKIFEALHKSFEQNTGAPSWNEALITEVFVKNGVAEDRFKNALQFSPGIDAQLVKARQLMMNYEISAVPCLLINGRYLVEGGTFKGDFKRMLAVADALIAQERQAKK